MITKKIAGDLYGNGFMLQDKRGVIFRIDALGNNGIMSCYSLDSELWAPVILSKIGTDYHILSRPISQLTESITHKGETFVPIVELAKIAFPACKWELNNEVSSCDNFDFYFLDNDFHADGYAWQPKHIPNQSDLFDKLREWNFEIGLPEGSLPVTDNNNPYKYKIWLR